MWGLLRIFSESEHKVTGMGSHRTVGSDLIVMAIVVVSDVRHLALDRACCAHIRTDCPGIRRPVIDQVHTLVSAAYLVVFNLSPTGVFAGMSKPVAETLRSSLGFGLGLSCLGQSSIM